MIAFDKKYSKVFAGKPRTSDNQDGVSHEEFFKFVCRRCVSLDFLDN